MTSISRSYAPLAEGLTRFVKPESPCYNDSGKNDLTVLFPFSYSNGVLDISYSGNTFQADMVTITGNSPSSETDSLVQIMGSPHLVTSLGDNFKAYIRAWRTSTIDNNSPITIFVNPQVIRVRELDYNNIDANSGNSYKISTSAPASDSYPTGSLQNEYETKYIFKTPLTITTIEGGVKNYITFKSVMDQE